MKKDDASLFVIIILALFIFIFYFITTSLKYYSFTDPIVKKYLLIIFFLIGAFIVGLLLNSISKAIILFLPIIFQFNRQLIPFSEIIDLPSSMNTDGINIIQVLIFFLFIIFLDLKKIIYYFSFKPMQSYMLFICIGLASIIWAFNKNAAISFLPNIFMLPFSYYVFSRLFEFNEKNILYLVIGLTFTGLISLIFVWPNYFGIKWFSSFIASNDPTIQSSDGSIRAGGVISRAGTAILLAAIIPFIYNFGLFYFTKYKKTVNIICILLMLTLVMTLNRMHFLATCCAIILIVWFAIKEKVMKLNVGYFFSGLIAFGIGVYYIISKNSATIEDIVYRSTYISRLQQYKAAYANLESSFGLGVGMNNFLTSPVTISILGVNNWALRTGNTVHNDLLRILAEYGLIGLISFIVCFIFLFTTTSKIVYAKAMIRGCKINIGVLLMIGLSSPAFNNITVIIICGFYMAIIRYYSSSATEETFLKSRYNLQ